MAAGITLCVDAGGTRCRGRLVAPDGTVLAEGEDGPCNPSTDLDRAVASLGRLWTACAAGHDAANVTLALGGAGLAAPAVRTAFLAALPRFGRTVAMSDGYAALIGAGGGTPSGLIIAGTGVVAHRLFADGRSIARDGWGWVGGDRGSGAWIGQRALRHALAAEDGVVPRDGLAARVLTVLRAEAGSPRAWITGLGPDRLAALAPLVLAVAEEGETTAGAILDRALGHLAALAGTLALGAGDALYLAGGLAPVMRPRLAARLGRAVGAPAADACTGCLLVATGAAPPETVLEPEG